MATGRNLQAETESFDHPMGSPSGKPYFDWDQRDDLVMPTIWQDLSQPSITSSRRRSASTASFPQPAGKALDNSDYWTHDLMNATHLDRRSWQPKPFDYLQRQGHDDGWNTGIAGLHYGYLETEHRQHQMQIPYGSNFHAHNDRNSSEIPTGPRITSTYSDLPSMKGSIGGGNASKGRRSTLASISAHSDATSSSHSEELESDPASLSDDLHDMVVGDHASPHLLPAFIASPRNYHRDPILGDLQHNLHNIVRQSLDPGCVVPEVGSENDTLDPRYKRQNDPRRFFRVGRVFSMLWHKNAGHHGTIMSQKGLTPGREYTKGKFQEPIYSSIRRMVVIKEQKGCCWCILVTTYSGQDIAKAGVDRNKHAVLYMRGTRPTHKAGEPRMVKEPLEVEPAKPDQRLDPMSRINFGKIYTVEHNVKVLPVGRITDGSLAKFIVYTKAELSK